MVDNIKNAIKYACGTPQGKKELGKTSFRDKNGVVVWKRSCNGYCISICSTRYY